MKPLTHGSDEGDCESDLIGDHASPSNKVTVIRVGSASGARSGPDDFFSKRKKLPSTFTGGSDGPSKLIEWQDTRSPMLREQEFRGGSTVVLGIDAKRQDRVQPSRGN